VKTDTKNMFSVPMNRLSGKGVEVFRNRIICKGFIYIFVIFRKGDKRQIIRFIIGFIVPGRCITGTTIGIYFFLWNFFLNKFFECEIALMMHIW